MHGIVWSYNVSNGPKSTYTGINAQNLDGLSEKSDWTSISGASLRKELLFWLLKQQHHWKTCLPLSTKLWCLPTPNPGCGSILETEGRLFDSMDIIFDFKLNKIQWEHCCNCNILLGTKLQVNRKSFTFPFSEWLDKKEKIVTTRLLNRVVKFFE